MSILNYFKEDEDGSGEEKKNELVSDSIENSENSDDSDDSDKHLTSIQRAKKKYMEKYTKTEKFKQINRDNYKKYYEQNSKKIYEERRKRIIENPELYEKLKEQQRLYSARRREMLKSQKNE